MAKQRYNRNYYRPDTREFPSIRFRNFIDDIKTPLKIASYIVLGAVITFLLMDRFNGKYKVVVNKKTNTKQVIKLKSNRDSIDAVTIKAYRKGIKVKQDPKTIYAVHEKSVGGYICTDVIDSEAKQCNYNSKLVLNNTTHRQKRRAINVPNNVSNNFEEVPIVPGNGTNYVNKKSGNNNIKSYNCSCGLVTDAGIKKGIFYKGGKKW